MITKSKAEEMICKNCTHFVDGKCKDREVDTKETDTCSVFEEFVEIDEKERLLLAYNEIKKILRKYVDMREDYYSLVTIWIIGTYFHDEFSTFPYLFINAMKGSGKSRLLHLIKFLSHNGQFITSLSKAVLFRTAKGHTLCIDEFEGIATKENQGLREILNAAYKKGITIKRMKQVKTKEGDNYEVEEFEPYTPICIANIWGMEEVLGSRCITMILEKSSDLSKIKLQENFDSYTPIKFVKGLFTKGRCSSVVKCSYINDIDKWNEYISNTYTTTLSTYTTQSSYTTQDPIEKAFKKIDSTGINGRNLELLFPLLMVAFKINGVVFDNLIDISTRMNTDRKKDEMIESKDILLIDYVSMQDSTDFIGVKKLTQLFRYFLKEDEDEDRWLNDKWMGRALKRLGLIREKRRVSNGIEVVLHSKKAKEKIKMFKAEESTDA